MKKTNLIISSILLFFILTTVSVTLDNSILMLLSLILAPSISYGLYKKQLVKYKKFNSILGILLVITLAFCSHFIGKTPTKSASSNVLTTETKTSKENDSNKNSNNASNKEKNSKPTNSNEKNSTNKGLSNSKDTESQIHFINTGNSDAILIKTKSKAVLIDGADNNTEDMLVKYLKDNKVNKLNYIIATHPHADHIGGLDAIIKAIDVDSILVANGSEKTKTYTDFITAAANKGLKPSVPLESSKFELGDNSYIQLFNSNGGKNTNEESLVTLFVNGKDKLLLMGDAETETENELIDKLPDVDLLKVGHHGSRSSTGTAFLNKINPEIAVLTTGIDNKYNHPHKATMDKLKNKNIEVHRTDECGTIVFTSTGNGLKTSCKKGSYSFRDNKDSSKNSSNSTTNNNAKKTSAANNSTSKSNTTKNTTTSTINNNSNTKNTSSNVQAGQASSNTSQNSGIMVWLSATGDKYHRINNCGRMNPSKATQVTLEEAKASYAPCSKCNPPR